MAGDPKAHVTLGFGDGETVVPVYERSLPYVLNRVGRFIDLIQNIDIDSDQDLDVMVTVLGGHAYEALVALMPNLETRMPKHRFSGYASVAAMEAGDFDEDAMEQAPSLPQIKTAFKTAMDVLGLDFSKLLSRWADPNILRPALNVRVAEWISGTSLRSPSESGDMTPERSGTSKTTTNGEVLAASPA